MISFNFFLNKTQLKIKIDPGANFFFFKKEFSMNKGLIARYHNSSGQIEERQLQLKTASFQSKLFISFIPI